MSFGLRGGKARVPSLETLTRLVDTDTLRAMDWATFSPNTADDDTLRAIETDVAAFFARHTMRELYAIACETNLMLAPINSPAEILASEQLAARDFWTELPDGGRAPRVVRDRPARRRRRRRVARAGAPVAPGPGAWAGTNILELGSGAAGPIATRYFAEQGATVLRIESKSRPDFLRVYALGPNNPHGLEGAPMFDGLNPAKRDVALQPQAPEGGRARAPARRRVGRRGRRELRAARDEGLRPRLRLARRAQARPRDDRARASTARPVRTRTTRASAARAPRSPGTTSSPAGPTASPSARTARSPTRSRRASSPPRSPPGLLHRRRTGRGVYLDVTQVEAAIYSLTPWLLDYQATGVAPGRAGNDDPRAFVHGVFPCADVTGPTAVVGDRWVAIAAWTEAERDRLHAITGADVGAYTVDPRRRSTSPTELQAAGIEAVPVQDFGDLHADPQLAHRGHFVPLTHPFLGPGLYERNGFRLSDATGGYDRSGPTLGQDQDWVLGDLLGLDPDEQAALAADGVFD